MKSMISAHEVSKQYGDLLALAGISFSIKPGRIVGLIGPNGAGKTTLLKAIFGLTPYQGELVVNGLSPRKQHIALMQQMCFIADVAILPAWMKVHQALSFVEGVHPKFCRDKAQQFLEKTGIQLQSKVSELSKGMVVQLHLALVMAIDVDLLVLDEPTLGLDIMHRKLFYERLMTDYYNEQKTIVITTHQVEEIENLLTDLIILDRGQIKLDIDLETYRQRFSQVVVPQAKAVELDALSPIYKAQQLSGVKMLFDGVDRDALAQYGDVSIPGISDVFLAQVSRGEQQ